MNDLTDKEVLEIDFKEARRLKEYWEAKKRNAEYYIKIHENKMQELENKLKELNK